MVQFAGEDEPEPLDTRGESTARKAVNDALGEGQGMLFVRQGCVWAVNAYPTKPYLAVQVTFKNTRRKPVRVSSLSPCSATSVYLGPGTRDARILTNGSDLADPFVRPEITTTRANSLWNVAVYNPATGSSLVAGALTHSRACTYVELGGREIAEDEDKLGGFNVRCVYEPPVEVPPDGELSSELVYISVGDSTPCVGLELYSKTVAKAMDTGPRRPFIPHSWGYGDTGVDQESLLDDTAYVDQNLKRYGWNHVTIGPGWEEIPGEWTPDPQRFPDGMKCVADEIHKRGMTAGLAISPFTAHRSATIVKAHPDWFHEPVGTAGRYMSEGLLVIDVTAPGAAEYVRQLGTRVGQQWGFDVLAEPRTWALLGLEDWRDRSLTRIQMLRYGLRTLREGFGEKGLITGAAPLPPIAGFVETANVTDWGPIGKHPGGKPTYTDEIAAASRRYYWPPQLWMPEVAWAGFEDVPQQDWDQRIARFTAMALLGGPLHVRGRMAGLSTAETTIIRKLLPVPTRPARPLDLFSSPTPGIWFLPCATPAGRWYIVALFNWDDSEPQTTALDFRALGLDVNGYYTVYDFWRERYYGTARAGLEIVVPPGSVRLLGLRRYRERPMLIAADRHFAQGAYDFRELVWNAGTRTLHGVFEGTAGTDYKLTILVPEGFTPRDIETSAGKATMVHDANLLLVSLHCEKNGPVDWTLHF